MSSLTDVLLAHPLPELWAQALLFFGFFIHLMLVLLMLGTAVLGVVFFIEAYGEPELPEKRWDERILRSFLGVKALAVVLGVSPLLVMQTAYSIPFLTATNLNTPVWLLVIGLLVVAFLAFDTLGHGRRVHRRLHLSLGIVALVCLLVVPGIFVAVVVTAENPGRWTEIARHGSFLGSGLGWFWLVRYLHVLGAAVVLGSTFQYWLAADARERSRLQKWIVGGLLFQVPVGAMLYGLLPGGPDGIAAALVAGGVVIAMIYVWLLFRGASAARLLRREAAFTVATLVILAMLLARQWHQDRTFLPFQRALAAQQATYRETLAPYREEALASYQRVLDHPVDDGATIYERSCAFCHGATGNGSGPSASRLEIQPAALDHARTTREYLHGILMSGIDGTAMPRFRFYDRAQIGMLVERLGAAMDLFGAPEPLPTQVSPGARTRAERVWSETCVECHGQDGSGASMSAPYQPPPPDLTQWFPGPQRSLEVVTQGYPGTMMPAFSDLELEERWALVAVVRSKYRPDVDRRK